MLECFCPKRNHVAWLQRDFALNVLSAGRRIRTHVSKIKQHFLKGMLIPNVGIQAHVLSQSDSQPRSLAKNTVKMASSLVFPTPAAKAPGPGPPGTADGGGGTQSPGVQGTRLTLGTRVECGDAKVLTFTPPSQF